MKCIERKIDGLGRIVIPICYRKALGLKSNDTVEVSFENSVITIAPKKRICAMCGADLYHADNMCICKSFIKSIKENENV